MDPAGRRGRPAWRLESTHKDAAAEFPRVVSLVLKDSFVVVEADIFNRRNEKQKDYTVRRLEQVEGIWTVMDSRSPTTREDADRGGHREVSTTTRPEGRRFPGASSKRGRKPRRRP